MAGEEKELVIVQELVIHLENIHLPGQGQVAVRVAGHAPQGEGKALAPQLAAAPAGASAAVSPDTAAAAPAPASAGGVVSVCAQAMPAKDAPRTSAVRLVMAFMSEVLPKSSVSSDGSAPV